MNAPAKHADAMPAIAEAALVEVLSGSLYPGAAQNSVVMVLAYCKAAQLDPMLKPVHIVPIYQKGRGMVDVVMPGIGLYRIQAARTGQYAGISDPEYGPAITATLAGVEVTYPEWCRVTVKRQMASGQIAEFTANERWLENYATASRDSAAPNAMWKRRAFAQLAKCAEAQALRKAFPEVGSAPTADEMEGKAFDDSARDVTPAASQAQREESEPAALPAYPDGKLEESIPAWRASFDAGKSSADHVIAKISTKYTLSLEQIKKIEALEALEGEQA
ncbi:phage recombination protein Bet [Pseudomonas cavernicola]|uniref:Phage recombination protein Bet n=1 Tax=Pseudomonas cavernicola TaxID=2320866 RepID=A0A418XF44_9PSED|nr:phage recombination protein Bet [Pseudomonas cavernicola]RJG10963.1 phage recombination protein Bet [Pseudomonas cavernicola]